MKSPLILFLAALALCAGPMRAEDHQAAPAAATAAVEKNVSPDEAEKLL